MALAVICPSCGERQFLEDNFPKRKVRCPACGVMCPVPEPSERKTTQQDEEEFASKLLNEVETTAPAPVPQKSIRASAPKKNEPLPYGPPTPPKAVSSQEDDGLPYVVEGGEDRRCPKCQRVVDEDAVLCVVCGFDFRKGKKLARTYEPVARAWDLGFPEARRWPLFLGLAALGLVVCLAGAVLSESWDTFVLSWLGFTVLLAFLLGTYFHMVLTRDRHGKVCLMRTWRICFVRRPTREIDLLQYAGVRVNISREGGILEWVIFFDLLLYGLIPGLLWWYHIIYTDRYHVALTLDHGRPEVIVYRGNDGKLAKEVAATLRDAGPLREELD
jgi:hypothetical protein